MFVCNNISIFVRNYSSSISKWSRYCDYSFIYNTFWNWFLTILFQEKFSNLKNSFFFFFHSRKYFVHIQSDLWPKKKNFQAIKRVDYFQTEVFLESENSRSKAKIKPRPSLSHSLPISKFIYSNINIFTSPLTTFTLFSSLISIS